MAIQTGTPALLTGNTLPAVAAAARFLGSLISEDRRSVTVRGLSGRQGFFRMVHDEVVCNGAPTGAYLEVFVRRFSV